MTIDVLYELCLSKKGVTEHFPFDADTLVFKVGGKMFALLSLQSWEEGDPTVILKCDPDRALELRATYEEILPGYHMNKKHWNSIYCNGSLSFALIKELIDHSYELVWKSLPKKLREQL